MTDDKNKPVLTVEQFTALYSVMGHAATQEQLNDVRKELDAKIDDRFNRMDTKLDKILYLIITLVLACIGGGVYLLDTINKIQ